MRGLGPRIHRFARVFGRRWIARSSPAMTEIGLAPRLPKSKSSGESPELFSFSTQASRPRAHPHHEAVETKFGHLHPGQRVAAERREARMHLAEVRIGLRQLRIDIVGG